jgi:hypothetical protein
MVEPDFVCAGDPMAIGRDTVGHIAGLGMVDRLGEGVGRTYSVESLYVPHRFGSQPVGHNYRLVRGGVEFRELGVVLLRADPLGLATTPPPPSTSSAATAGLPRSRRATSGRKRSTGLRPGAKKSSPCAPCAGGSRPYTLRSSSFTVRIDVRAPGRLPWDTPAP